ncbi:Bypass of stop codon protein-like protein [Hapsidospora chrysogenum ATCC 11550]|uniref:Bypass of stop codon protein-like protein n=1 Tax=Hapsidospora chrysogenum (strain ATCC 11550 / CBS 779.69 / DSM 880 / IAM 14645 / JCM 23072 / IMI 49137) TaxID=857340 RepID=A0A086T8C2_HAPC1|nr:Bypass of stop codon protein-like protein [Hapsidospora chrysogenum ATCC 11550]
MSQTATITHGASAIELASVELHHSGSQRDNPNPKATAVDDGSPSATVADPSEPPPNAHREVERWNKPKGNIGRLAFAFLSFIIAGMNDGAVGALIPYLEEFYQLSYTIVSLIFLTPFAGYSIAAFTNARIHMSLGQRGVAFIAPLCHVLTYVVLAVHPPWPALVVINMISGFGNGLTDACFCSWVGAMDKANTIQGFMHSCYSLGALLAPLIATSMVVKAQLPWYTFYYVMIGISVLEWVGLAITFWHKTGAVYRDEHKNESESSEGAGTREALKSKVTWLCSLFFFAYMGVEVGLGGWVVTFMLRVRNASAYASGISGTGFWAGMAAGRASLGFVTERFGERLCVIVYLALSIGLQLLFWLVPQFIVSAVAVAFLGFFLGPLFPGAVMVTAKLLPKRIHVSAIGFAMALGGTGGTVFPFAIGALASYKGVAVLQPIILALIVVVALVWLSFPRIKKRE